MLCGWYQRVYKEQSLSYFNMVWDKKKWTKEYNEKNREKINEYFRRYYQKNKLKHITLTKKWRREHPEKIAEYAEKLKTPERAEKNRIYAQEWRAKNKEKIKIYHKRWQKKLKQL